MGGLRSSGGGWIIASLAALTIAGPALPGDPSGGPGTGRPMETEATARPAAAATAVPTAVRFEQNLGQADASVRYLARGHGYALFLTASEAVLTLAGPADRTSAAGEAATVVRMRVVPAAAGSASLGASVGASLGEPVGERLLPGRTSSFVGDDPQRWVTAIPSYGAVRYPNVQRGIDLVYHGGSGRLEYDVVVQPGIDPAGIAFAFDGVSRLHADAGGALVLATQAGDLRQEAPFAFQDVAGRRRQVAAAYTVHADGTAGFRVGPHDDRYPLVIDPVLVTSSFLAGSSDDRARAVAVGAAGSTFVTGETLSADFPARGSPAPRQDGSDVFVTRVDRRADGSSVIGYSAYLGGSAREAGLGIAADPAGRAWVVGETRSTGFPTTPGALQPVRVAQAVSTNPDAFVVRLDPTPGGVALGYSTYYGTNAADSATSVALDPFGDAWVTGATSSPTGLPTTEGAHRRSAAGGRDGFAARFDGRRSGAASLLAGTYLGGGLDEIATAVAADGRGNAFVTGQTVSLDLPVTPGAVQPVRGGGGDGTPDAFVIDVGPSAELRYATYLGGADRDSASGIAVAGSQAYVTGQTFSADFPVSSTGLRTAPAQIGNSDGFVAVVDTAVAGPASLVYGTYLGGPTRGDLFVLPPCACTGTAQSTDGRGERGAGIAVGPDGIVYLAGETTAVGFPVTPGAFQPTKAGPDTGINGPMDVGDAVDGFVAGLDPTRDGPASLVFASYLGGGAQDLIAGVALRAPSNLVVVGSTQSGDFPVISGAFQERPGGVTDAFVSEVSGSPAATPRIAGLVPRGGPTAGGTRVRITGSGLAAVTAVRFGALPATFTLVSDTELSVLAPAQAAGNVGVSVHTPAASSFLAPATRYFYGDEGIWSPVSSPVAIRYGHTATLLADGRVLVAGGSSTPNERTPVRAAEVYDPVSGTWATGGLMGRGRTFQTATLLRNGKVLVVGGVLSNGFHLAASELFDPPRPRRRRGATPPHWPPGGTAIRPRCWPTAASW